MPNLTIGPMVLKSLRKYGITAPIDVHLMVKPVDRLVPDFAAAGASILRSIRKLLSMLIVRCN
jgi:ribulose-phosphate 3-epimerase